MTTASQDRPNPYVGPRAFTRGETLYGRDREIMELLDLLIAERIVLLYSPSGAGKTSLIQAALIPELEKEGFQVLPPMRASLEPETAAQAEAAANRYILSLLLSLEEELPPEDQTPLDELASLTLSEYLDQHLAGDESAAASAGTVLIFDQLEEILTVDPTNREAKAEFFAQVGAALRDRQRWALFAMREEFVAGLDPYLRPLPTRLDTTYRLELLGLQAATEAMQEPARTAGVEFTDDAADRLVDDLRAVRIQEPDGTTTTTLGDYVEPVQLQVVCFRLWERLPADATQIVEADVEAAGDVDTALADYYAERVAAVATGTGVRERAIRDWFDRQLITEQGIRGQVLQGPEESNSLDNRAIWPLVDAHLVRAEKRRGATWFELAHDRLIEPVQENNAAWRETHLSPLQRQAALWEDQGRPGGLLLRGDALEEAEGWAQAHDDELTGVERAFLRECQEARATAEREERQARRIRWLAVGATVFAAIACLLAVIAGWQMLAAQEARRFANLQQDAAETAAAEAAQARDLSQSFQATLEANLLVMLTLQAPAPEIALAPSPTPSPSRSAGPTATLAQPGETLMPVPLGTPTRPGQTREPIPLATPTATYTAPPSPTPDQAATAAVEAATVQAVQTQLAGIQATQLAVARCAFEPQGEFSEIWIRREVQPRLGCPLHVSPVGTFFAEQAFEGGTMYWSEIPDLFIVTIGGDRGDWYLFRTEEIDWPWNPSGVSCEPHVPLKPGQILPVRGFGGLWCANPEIQARIGFATEGERGVTGNLLQEFENGFILRDSQGYVYVLFGDNGTYVRQKM